MKECICCHQTKPLEDFYVHKQMKDGHVNRCIECCKKAVMARFELKMKDPAFVLSEQKRHEEKRNRLYRNAFKPIIKKVIGSDVPSWKRHFEKFPEKYKAEILSQRIQPKIKGNQLHHWSYKEENATDLIEVSKSDHYRLHKKIHYSQEHFCFIFSEDNTLLDTKEKHLSFLQKIDVEVYQ